MTPQNIKAGFKRTGIWPPNPDVIPSELFAVARKSESKSVLSLIFYLWFSSFWIFYLIETNLNWTSTEQREYFTLGGFVCRYWFGLDQYFMYVHFQPAPRRENIHFGRVCVQVLIQFSLIFYVCSLSASTSQAAVVAAEVEEDDEVKETQDEDEGDEAEGRLLYMIFVCHLDTWRK